MNKEELEKEAIAKYKTGSYPQLHPDHYAFIHGYLAGAEPRERQIEKLKDDLCRVTSDRDGYRTVMLSYEHKIKDLENKLTEQKRQIKITKECADAELKSENIVLKKALHLYVDWADECGIAWDNFPDMKEKWYKTVEEKGLGWIDGLVFMAIEEAKEQIAKAALNNEVDK